MEFDHLHFFERVMMLNKKNERELWIEDSKVIAVAAEEKYADVFVEIYNAFDELIQFHCRKCYFNTKNCDIRNPECPVFKMIDLLNLGE